MHLFVRVTLGIAALLVALVVLMFVLKLLVVAAVIAAVVVALAFIVRMFRAGWEQPARFG